MNECKVGLKHLKESHGRARFVMQGFPRNTADRLFHIEIGPAGIFMTQVMPITGKKRIGASKMIADHERTFITQQVYTRLPPAGTWKFLVDQRADGMFKMYGEHVSVELPAGIKKIYKPRRKGFFRRLLKIIWRKK